MSNPVKSTFFSVASRYDTPYLSICSATNICNVGFDAAENAEK